MTPQAMSTAGPADSDLVGQTLAGNREAFSRIVARYQSLVCSLAYSATGSFGQSEDLAQETFITAWKHLCHLRDRDKLRAWLCGIARNHINNFLRREGREPVCGAQPLETVSESRSPEPLPLEHTISCEEQQILWHTLERIPETYREPLVLFYRQHQSVERVAEALDLSEDAVHQRLSRGRKMLQEQILAFVEGALEQTNPGKPFTANVMASLPMLAMTAKAATAGTAAAKSGAAAFAAFFQTILKVVVPIGVFASLGGWLGYKMGNDAGQSAQQRESVARFWGILTASLVMFVLLPLLLVFPLVALFGTKENFLAAMRIWLDVMFVVIAIALALWVWQRRKSRCQQIVAPAAGERMKRIFIWSVALATIVSVSLFVLGLSDTNWKIDRISIAQAQKIVHEKSQNAQFFVMRFHYHSAFKNSGDDYDELWIRLQDHGTFSKFVAPSDPETLSLLAEKGIDCPIYVQGRDFEIFGWQGKLLMGLCLFIPAAGIAAFLTLILRNKSNTRIMTTGTKIGIAVAVVLAALIVTPLAWLNHRKANSVHPNQIVSQTLTPERSAQAKQTARDFFEAMGKGDWNDMDKLCPPGFPLSAQLGDETKNALTGLELVSLGDPFTKPGFPQVWVPYEIRFKSGETKKFNLAVRQDNPERKWYFDGGF